MNTANLRLKNESGSCLTAFSSRIILILSLNPIIVCTIVGRYKPFMPPNSATKLMRNAETSKKIVVMNFHRPQKIKIE